MRVRTAREIGALIRERRTERGWGQQDLADHINTSRLWVSEVENGKPSVRLDLVLRALDSLGVQLDAGQAPVATESRAAKIIREMLEKK